MFRSHQRIERESLGGHAYSDLHVHFIKSIKIVRYHTNC